MPDTILAAGDKVVNRQNLWSHAAHSIVGERINLTLRGRGVIKKITGKGGRKYQIWKRSLCVSVIV